MLVHIWSSSEKTQFTIQMLCQHWAEKREPRNTQVVRFLFRLSAHRPERQLSNGGSLYVRLATMDARLSGSVP